MKTYQPRKKLILFCFAILCAATFVGGVGVWNSRAFLQSTTSNEPHVHMTYVWGMQSTLKEIKFSSRGDSALQVQDAIDSFDSFMARRSGYHLPQGVKDDLLVRERNFVNGGPGVPITKISQVLTDVFVERLTTLTDNEIAFVSNTLTGVKATDSTDLPYTDRVLLFREHSLADSPDSLTKSLIDFRNDSSQQILAKGYIHEFIERTVSRQIKAGEEAYPGLFITQDGNDKVVSPLGLTLLTYSQVSGDYLLKPTNELYLKMDKLYNYQRSKNLNWPDPSAYTPYGDKGYLHSTPLSLFFRDQSVKKMLDKAYGG